MPYDPITLFERIKTKLSAAGMNPRLYASLSLRSKCPAHGGKNDQSLHVQVKEDKVLIHCHSGECGYKEVLSALGVEDIDQKLESCLIDAVRYIYKDETGKIVGSQLRRMFLNKNGGWEKQFIRETYDAEAREWKSGSPSKEDLIPYNLPELLTAAKKGDQIWIVEGEKDVETLAMHGITGTAFMGGQSGWMTQYAKWFRGTRVVICGDRDEPGQKFCGSVKEGLTGIATEVLSAELPYKITKSHGKDVSDFLSINSASDLEALVDAPWKGPGIYTIADALDMASNNQKIPLDHYYMVGMGPGYDLPGIGPGIFLGIVARLGGGKTAWIVDLASRAIADGKRIMFVSYDETAASIASYLATSITGDYTFVTKDQELLHMRKAPNTCKKLEGVDGIIDGHVKTPDAIAETAFRHKPDILFVDHLAKVLPDNPKDRDYIRLGKAASMFRKIANEGNCSVVAALQSNREGQHGVLANVNVAGSDEIAREMDAILGLQHPATNDSEERKLNQKRLLSIHGQKLETLFEDPIGELGMRLRPSLRVINTVKSRMSKGDGIWPIVFYGAERRLFPVHSVGCSCGQCTKRTLTQSAHDYIVKRAKYGDTRDKDWD